MWAWAEDGNFQLPEHFDVSMKNMKTYLLLFIPVLVFVFSSCEKNIILKNNKSLQGLWRITEFNYSDSANVTVKPASAGKPAVKIDTVYALHQIFDLSKEIHTLSFFEAPESAYSAAMQAVYKIDYADAALKDISDTFYYTITKDVLAVVKKSTTKKTYTNVVRKPFLSIVPLGQLRYQYNTPSGNSFTLDASPFLNGTQCYYKLEKSN
jgi:hypothetical protein